MYKSFYNLTRNPFDLTPDPTCFVPTVRHNEALAALYYGIRRHKGVVVVTGEVGTGKTLMLRCLLQLFKESSEIAYAYLFNCRLTPLEFLHYTAADFGLPVEENQSKSGLLLDLSRYVTSRGLQGLTTVLVVDEAHNLSMELLEEIRLLSNLETNNDKLLQIVLVGQPELDVKLDSYALRPLKQRIALRAHLTPLDEQDTDRYIVERLTIAGGGSLSETLFTPEAVKTIHQYSRGYPRLINTICGELPDHGICKATAHDHAGHCSWSGQGFPSKYERFEDCEEWEERGVGGAGTNQRQPTSGSLRGVPGTQRVQFGVESTYQG